MTPQEKLDWFWALGELPGSVFDDLNDRKREMPGLPRRQQAKRLRPGSRKRHEEASKPNASRIDLKQRS